VSMSFLFGCGPGICPIIIIYFRLLHNQGVRFKIISTIGHVLCVLLFMNGFMPSVLIAILIFLGPMANSGFCISMFCHYVALVGCLIIFASSLYFSLCHRNNFHSLFAKQLFRLVFSSISVAVLIITAIFSYDSIGRVHK
jgi:uncharacterized membrane protein